MEIDAIVRKLNALSLPLRKGCSAEEIHSAESALSCSLSPELVTLFKSHDGLEDTATFPFRLMSLKESIDIHNYFEDSDYDSFGGFYNKWKLRFFWTDDSSNWAGIYLDGPLKGRISFAGVIARHLTPAYRSIQQFYIDLFVYHEEDTDMPFYELMFEKAPSSDADVMNMDRSAINEINAILTEINDTIARDYLIRCICVLTPFEDTENLISFLNIDDIWIPQYAAEIIGTRKFGPAIQDLEKLAMKGKPNGSQEAIRSLGKIGSIQARESLRRIQKALPENINKSLINEALLMFPDEMSSSSWRPWRFLAFWRSN